MSGAECQPQSPENLGETPGRPVGLRMGDCRGRTSDDRGPGLLSTSQPFPSLLGAEVPSLHSLRGEAGVGRSIGSQGESDRN